MYIVITYNWLNSRPMVKRFWIRSCLRLDIRACHNFASS